MYIHSWILMTIYIYIYIYYILYIPWYSPCAIFAMAKDDHGTRKPSIHGTGSASSTSRPWSPKIPMESNVYDVFFSNFFDDRKKEWWCFPRISGSSSSKNHVIQWELPCWPPFFTSVFICYLGFKPQVLHRPISWERPPPWASGHP